jgi:hypothetical protein
METILEVLFNYYTLTAILSFLFGFAVCSILVSGAKADLDIKIINLEIEIETLQIEAKLLREVNEQTIGQLNLCRNQLHSLLVKK